jgi:hypothetical protein
MFLDKAFGFNKQGEVAPKVPVEGDAEIKQEGKDFNKTPIDFAKNVSEQDGVKEYKEIVDLVKKSRKPDDEFDGEQSVTASGSVQRTH